MVMQRVERCKPCNRTITTSPVCVIFNAALLEAGGG